MTRPNLEGRRFASVAQSPGSDVTATTVFLFTQRGDLVWAAYAGGGIGHGHLIGVMDDVGNLDVRFHHVTTGGALKSGTTRSTYARTADGRIAYLETWTWTTGAIGGGHGRLEEVVTGR